MYMMMQSSYMLGSREQINNDALNTFFSSQGQLSSQCLQLPKLHMHFVGEGVCDFACMCAHFECGYVLSHVETLQFYFHCILEPSVIYYVHKQCLSYGKVLWLNFLCHWSNHDWEDLPLSTEWKVNESFLWIEAFPFCLLTMICYSYLHRDM